MAFEIRPYIWLENLIKIGLFVKEKSGGIRPWRTTYPLNVLFFSYIIINIQT